MSVEFAEIIKESEKLIDFAELVNSAQQNLTQINKLFESALSNSHLEANDIRKILKSFIDYSVCQKTLMLDIQVQSAKLRVQQDVRKLSEQGDFFIPVLPTILAFRQVNRILVKLNLMMIFIKIRMVSFCF